MSCKNCKNALKRSDYSFSQYGDYQCGYECMLVENEKTPYRRLDDSCEKFEEVTK